MPMKKSVYLKWISSPISIATLSHSNPLRTPCRSERAMARPMRKSDVTTKISNRK